MTQDEALGKVGELVAKGWRITLFANKNGWTCQVVGAGLANAGGGGRTVQEAVSSALSRALAMEDDPAVVIARYEAWIKKNVEDVFGPGTLVKVCAEPDEFDGGPNKIAIHVRCSADNASIQDWVNRQGKFYQEKLFGAPAELLDALHIWPVFSGEPVETSV